MEPTFIGFENFGLRSICLSTLGHALTKISLEKKIPEKLIIVQFGWPIQSFTSLLAIALSKKWRVTIFIDSQSLDRATTDLSRLEEAGISIVEAPTIFSFLGGARSSRSCRRIIGWLRKNSPICKKFEHFMASRKLRGLLSPGMLAVAVEKEALVIADAAQQNGPLVYYSLELYLDSHDKTKVYRYIRENEKRAIRRLSALIIQDRFREDTFKRENCSGDVRNFESFLMPVSVVPVTGGGSHDTYWHQTYNLSEDIRVVLYFGLISREGRGLQEFIDGFRFSSANLAFVIHGYGDISFIEELKNKYRDENIFVSTNFVPESEIDVLIRSADVGLTWYSCENENSSHTAFASEKIALFLRAGKPILTNSGPTYHELFSSYSCGLSDKQASGLARRLPDLFQAYASMRREALDAYTQFYDFEKNSIILLKQIEDLVGGNG